MRRGLLVKKLPRSVHLPPARCLSSAGPSVTTSVVPSTAGKGPFGGEKGGTVTGFTAPGWEDFREAFERNFGQNLELGAQVVVYKDGEPVVDLHGYSPEQGESTYTADTLQNMFSSGKNLEAIVCMMLVDRGLLKYVDLIADHWPAFGQHGKEKITVEDVLRHEAGLQFFSDPQHLDDFKKNLVPTVADVTNTADGAVERVIEGCAPWGYGKRMYHASTRGFIIGGLVRQITGNTLGNFIKTEIQEPLGLTLFCGTPLEEQEKHHYAAMAKSSGWYALTKELIPGLLGRPEGAATWATVKLFAGLAMDSKHPLRGYAHAVPAEWTENGGDSHHVSTPEGRLLEVSSGGMQGNARSVAKLAALMANRGELGGVRLVSAEAVDNALSEPLVKRDEAWKMTLATTKGLLFLRIFFCHTQSRSCCCLLCCDLLTEQLRLTRWIF